MSGADAAWPTHLPLVGVGCIAVRAGRLLLIRGHDGRWGPPGGHLDLGESPEACAVRETREETGVGVTGVEFVALTNDLFEGSGRHYVTIWFRADADGTPPVIGEPSEVAAVGWFAPDALPTPWFLCWENLLTGRCLPAAPANLPFADVLWKGNRVGAVRRR